MMKNYLTSNSSLTSLLDVVAVGKILFKNQPQLTNQAIKNRVHRLRLSHGLPMTKLGKTYVISEHKLDEWFSNKNI